MQFKERLETEIAAILLGEITEADLAQLSHNNDAAAFSKIWEVKLPDFQSMLTEFCTIVADIDTLRGVRKWLEGIGVTFQSPLVILKIVLFLTQFQVDLPPSPSLKDIRIFSSEIRSAFGEGQGFDTLRFFFNKKSALFLSEVEKIAREMLEKNKRLRVADVPMLVDKAESSVRRLLQLDLKLSELAIIREVRERFRNSFNDEVSIMCVRFLQFYLMV